jgi:poly(A) polymerase
MINIKKLIIEGVKEKIAEEYLSNLVRGSEWENFTYIAGGYVRDELIHRDAKDIDIVINLPNGGIKFAEWITKKIGNYKEGSNPVVYSRFSTAKFNLRGVIYKGIDLSDVEIETVQSRSEKYTTGSRKPDVDFSDLKSDAERRDTTINSLFKKLTTGEIYDLTGKGLDDLKKGIVRTPIDPDKTFTDDPLRLLRIVRMSVKYNWGIPFYILKSMKKNAPQLQNISQERIMEELNKMIVTDYPKKAIELMRITGLLKYVIPELIPLIKLQQNKFHKHDAWNHTMEVLSKTKPILIQRLMALFHDIGKFVTKSITDTGIHFYGHEKEGAKIVGEVMHRLKYPNELIDAVKAGVRYHMKLKHGGDEANISDKTLREFVVALGDNLENTLDVIHADNIAHADVSSMPNQITKIKERLKTLEIRKPIGKKENLPLTGRDLLDMGVPEGPLIGKIKNVIKKAVLRYPDLSKEKAAQIAGKMMRSYMKNSLTENYDEGMNQKIRQLEKELEAEFPQLEELNMYLGSSGDFYLDSLKVKKEERGKGIGEQIMEKIVKFADDHNLYITLHPSPEPRYKAKLDKFYRQFGFFPNKGRRKMYQFSRLFHPTMIRRPISKEKIAIS